MSEPIVWENIPKSQSDPTTIEDAIAAGLDAHNADSEAHMAELEAIAEHRENPVIDHPAESVVNDKLQVTARAYVAIVDPTDEEAFDTLESAIAYAISVGGGNIFLAAGEHYLSAITNIPFSINLYGEDPNTTILHGELDDDKGLHYDAQTGLYNNDVQIANLTIFNDGGGLFTTDNVATSLPQRMTLTNVIMDGGGRYFHSYVKPTVLRDCVVLCSNTCAIEFYNRIECKDTIFQRYGTSSNPVALGFEDGGDDETRGISCWNTRFISSGATGCNWFKYPVVSDCLFRDCSIGNLSSSGTLFSRLKMYNTIMDFNASSFLHITSDRSILIGNEFTDGTGNRVRLNGSSARCIVLGNDVGTSITNSGTNNQVANNVLV